MPTTEGAQLSQIIRLKIEEVRKLCEGLGEDRASRAPTGRWSPKEILSHLCGPEGRGLLPTVKVILEQDTPRIDIEAENPFFSEKRARMTVAELLTEFEKEYGRMAELVEELSEEQLARKAHIPLLKETPMGEHPTLTVWVQTLGAHHVDFHINHMREILQALSGASAQ